MTKHLSIQKVFAALLTIVAVMVGHQAMADDKTVTYTISYTGTNTLTATPDVAGFDGSTEVITGPAINESNSNFGLLLHDNLEVIVNLYNSSGSHRMYVSNDGVTFNFAANITTCCSNYYIKHIAMKDHNGTAIMVYDLNAYPPTNFSFDLDVDLDKLGASGAPTTVTEHHVRTANNTTTIKTITITYGTSPRSYNISYTNAVNGQNGVTNNNRTTYSVDTPTFNVTAPTRTGYDFDGFTYTDAAHPTATNATLPMSISRGEAATRKAITFNASWTPITYSISYDLAGGSVATANPTTYTVETATFTLNNPTRTGYTFAGWTGTDLNEPTVTVTIAQGSIGDRSYTATWTPITYNISYDLAGGSVATANPTTYNIETATFTLNNPTRTGYTFAGWTGTDLNGPTMNVTIAQGSIGDRSYTATWNIITYNLTYNLAGGSMATANPTTYNIETATFTLNNPIRTGYTFAGWTGTDLNEPTVTVTIAQGSIGDRSYTATWTPITYNISYDLAGGSVATANPTTYNIETATFTLNNPTRTGYTFAGWTGTDLNGPTMNVTIAQGSIGDRSYTATWNIITYNLAYDLAGGSMATANPTTYHIETATFTLNNPTRVLSTFAGWTGTGLEEPTMNVTIEQGSTGDRSYTATWTLIPVTYIDADGNQQTCTDFTIIESSESDVDLGTSGQDEWYVVSGNVTINGQLFLRGFNSHLILCDGATLNINHTNNDGLYSNQNLIIYGQSVGNGTLTASAPWNGISTNNNLTINGGIISATSTISSAINVGNGITINRGSVTAHGHYNGIEGENIIINGGIVNATNGEGSDSYGIIADFNITLGYTKPTDRITASSYKSNEGTISVKAGQTLYDGTEAVYSGTLNSSQIDAIAGKTLQPCFILTLPEHVNATGVISQEGTTAYALAGAEITLAAVEGYEITDGTTSFTMPAQNVVSDVTVQVITYNISYDLAGGSVATANPTTYNIETEPFTLNNPTRVLSTFAGWTGTGLDEPTMNVTIAQGSTGDRSYTATWSLLPVTYIDADGVERTLYDYTLLEGSDEYITYGNNNVEAWYVVAHDVTYSDGFAFRGSTNLILVDGATLTVTNVSGNHSNVNCDNGTIYVQSGGTGAIVGENIQIYSYGSMTIHGGHITLSGRNYGLYSTDDITINGGQISIEAQWGCIYAEYDVTINGGVVTTTNQQGGYGIFSSGVTINGGVVTTTNQQGGYGIFSSGVTINGGVVTANAPNGGYGISTQFSDLLITLGWTNETDRITSDSYYGTVTTVTGKAFTDGEGNYYAGTYYGNEISALAGKTLTPCTNLDEAFHITYVINGGTMPSGYPETYTFDETVTLPVPTKADNTFVGWYKDYYFNYDPITEIAAGTTLGDLTLYASWKPEKTWVDYLDADGQPQRAYATILYGGDEAEYPAGVYTLEEIIWGKSYGGGSYNRLNFTGDAILILPDYCSLSIGGERDNDGEDGLFVNGDLTIYGQTLGFNDCFASRIQTSGNVAIYGGYLDIDNLSASNITLGWTGLENKYSFNQVAGNVTLANDFRLQNDQGTSVVHAGSITSSELEQASLYPYATTIEVSYMDENGDTQTVNATVLWGDETNLPGGFYTIMEEVHIRHDLSFNGNTTLIVPFTFFTLNGKLTVDGNLSVYGIGFFTIQDIEATGDVLFCIDDANNPSSTLTASGNVFIAHGCFSAYRIYGSTITLGYLYNNDYIRCGSNNQNGYFGNVVVREGQALQQGGNVYSGTLTAEQISAIKGKELKPYIPTMPTLAVTGYGESTESDHWVFIASPIMSFIDPYSVTNLIGGMSPSGQSNFDLYRFNQSAELEWENFYQHLTGGNSFALENGKGYLYANKNDVTLEFNGVVYPAASKEVALDYDANAEFAGWNLVGNPFHAPAILDKSYYKMNSDGTGLVAEAVSGNTAIDAFTGVMVQANGEDETVLFTKSNAKGQQETGFGTLQIALTQTGTRGNALLDNAIVSFNEGDQLGKFYFGTQDANIYIPQGNEEYAIVSAGNTGEIPVNFKAKENGTYTISVNPEGVEMDYLHLIDNMTGADVDLLTPAGNSPSERGLGGVYTFTAKTTDYESRFKLVFSADEDVCEPDEAFAFISNGNIIVNGEGTLQVFDVLGHQLVTKQLSTLNSQLSTPLTKGVYVLRLINGENVRTQKIVVE